MTSLLWLGLALGLVQVAYIYIEAKKDVADLFGAMQLALLWVYFLSRSA